MALKKTPIKNRKKLIYIIPVLIITLCFGYYFYSINYLDKTKIPITRKSHQLTRIKYINENNSQIIKLNNRKSNLPFHPIKIRVIDNKAFYLDSGKLFYIDLKNNNYKSVEVKTSFKNNELVSMAVDKNSKRIFLIDKLNNIYSYWLKNNSLKLESRTFPEINKIEPEYLNLTFDKSLFILDSAQNKIVKYNNSKKTFLNTKDINLTETIDLYSENSKNYVLERGNILKVISNSLNEFNLIQNSDIYGYLGLFSESNLKNIYFSGGYNGNILSFSKNENKVSGLYYISLNNNPLPVYDVSISNNKIYIIAGNYLVIHKDFKEDDFSNSSLKFNTDLLDTSIKKSYLKNFLIPLENYSSMLPIHSSVYPGARRLYRYGIHEGIDFFDDGDIKVDNNTPVISAKDGTVIRIDKKYQEMSVKNHQNILNQCLTEFYTSAENIDKLRGRQIWIKHEGNVVTIYAHLSKVNNQLEIGSVVEKGDLIGYVGNSGTTDGVYKTNKGMHLHFELHIDDKSKKLEYYLGKYLPIEETMQIYRKILE